MNGGDSPGEAEGVRATNGTHRETRKNGAAKVSAAKGGAEAASVAPPLAGPLAVEAVPIDLPMWPLQAAAWLQPEIAPIPPVWSGLTIERHNRIPAPDFWPSASAPLNRSDAPHNSLRALIRAAKPAVPAGDLAPLGWDPRSVCWKRVPAAEPMPFAEKKGDE